MVFKYGLGVLVGVLLLGCSSKENDRLMETYSQKSHSYKMLQKTEKLQFKENNETTLLLTVSYINTQILMNDDVSDEIFLLGIYSDKKEMKSLPYKDFEITLKNLMTKEEKITYKKQKFLKEDLRIKVSKKVKVKKVKYVKPKDIQLVSKDSPYLKDISFVSDWSQFYLIKFKHMAGNRLILRIKSKKSEEALLKEKTMVMKKQQNDTKKIVKKKKIKRYKTDLLYFSKVAKYAL